MFKVEIPFLMLLAFIFLLLALILYSNQEKVKVKNEFDNCNPEKSFIMLTKTVINFFTLALYKQYNKKSKSKYKLYKHRVQVTIKSVFRKL